MLPVYVRACIKAGFPAEDALDYEACLQKRYEEIKALHGDANAAKWLRFEALACLTPAALRLARFLAFWS